MSTKYRPESRGAARKKLIVIVTALAVVIVSIAGMLMAWDAMIPEDVDDPIPDFAYGNDTISVKYAPDVKLITPDPGEAEAEGVNVEPQAIAVSFSDGFESGDTSKWDDSSCCAWVSSLNPESGSYSCRFNPPNPAAVEYIKKEDLELCADADLNLEFDAYISDQFRFGSSDIILFQHYDMFVVKLKFTGGKSLVYVIGGVYVGGPSEAVIDVRSQVDNKSVWSHISIDGIQNDYAAHFEEEMPDEADLKFYVKSVQGEVYLDNVYLECETPPPQPRMYWDHEGQEVLGYFIAVEYEMSISDDVNESNAFIEIMIWVTTESSNGTEVADKELLQDAIIKVEDFDDEINWTSATFSLPDDNVYGDTLNYTFDIWVSAFAQIENTSYWVEDNHMEKDFDTFEISWTNEGFIILSVVIVGVVSTVGIVSTAVALKLHKKRRNAIDCDCKGQPDCKCDI